MFYVKDVMFIQYIKDHVKANATIALETIMET